MKTITGIFLMFALAFLTSCIGEEGPPGPPGEDGESFLGSVFEIEGDFTSQNDYSLYFEFPSSITVYESDVVLVYILWEQAEDNNGEWLDVWRLLPQTVVLYDDNTGNNEVLQYNYDHTFADVQVFLEGTIDFNTLLPAEAQDQIFRIVVLPADFVAQKNLDVSDYNMMMKSLEVKPEMIQKLETVKPVNAPVNRQ
ncbi:hypothetical protein SAMN05444280_12813 [Tangfeifania diversioriginum]|uniref:Collagen triple helix repeat-containing protein n=1 Tax=Tangfeifania diversioriginum TaxID=1168035 RepID=A0A1M6LSA7_9BACT|nr:hypothetical protein [Tangfeifania diversioriginum]SHJ74091.1 hypothetical protein SAMN05444280_12813 [Tangfeifania diversioriginum]